MSRVIGLASKSDHHSSWAGVAPDGRDAGPYYPRVSSPLISTPRRRLATIGTLGGLCLFAWWSVQPVGGDCPDEGLTLSSDPFGSTYDPADTEGGGDVEYEGRYTPLEGPAPSPTANADVAAVPDAAVGPGDHDPCGAETRHPRLYGWLGL